MSGRPEGTVVFSEPLDHSGPQLPLRKDESSKWSRLGPWEEYDSEAPWNGRNQGVSLEVMSAILLPPEGRRVLLSDPGRGRGRTPSSSPAVLRKESSLKVCVCSGGGPPFGRAILC